MSPLRSFETPKIDTRTGCGTISRSGSQTIAFKSVRRARLSLLRIPRSHGFTYYGTNFVRSQWTLSRTFAQSAPPTCREPLAAQASDCGARGPYAVPVDVTYAWRAAGAGRSG